MGLFNHVGDKVEKVPYEKQLRNLMKMKEGTIITGKDMDKYYPDSSKAFNKITRVKGGIKFDVKFKAKLAMPLLISKVKDGSVAYLSDIFINDPTKGRIAVLYMNSPDNILRSDPMTIYINDNSYTLPKLDGKWYNLGD